MSLLNEPLAFQVETPRRFESAFVRFIKCLLLLNAAMKPLQERVSHSGIVEHYRRDELFRILIIHGPLAGKAY